jgi:hypothetical protein
MTWQALTEALQNSQEAVNVPGMADPEVMSCITVGVSELGTFLRPDDGELVDTLVAMWDGQKEVWRRQTKTQGETIIHNPWLNIIACTTPAWLKDNFPDVLIGGGLTSRMIFVFADRKRQFVAYPAKLVTANDYKREEELLIHDLLDMSQMVGEYHLTESAIKWGEQWYEEHWSGPRPLHMASDKFGGYIARKQTHLHKLAIVLSAAKRSELVIDKEELIQANEFTTGIEADMQNVFTSIGVNPTAKLSGEVLNLIKTHKEITYQDLWRLCFSTMGSKDFTEAIKAALEAGYIRIEARGDKKVIVYIPRKKVTSPSVDLPPPGKPPSPDG